MKIPVIINNRDLLLWPKAMVERISKYDNVGDIIIVDNGSTYQPLLDWYDTNPCTIERCENLGFRGAWDSGLVKKLNSPYYVVTDSDLGLEETPDNTLNYLLDNVKGLNLDKLGLGLDWEKVTNESPYYNHIQGYEVNRWNNTRKYKDIGLDIATDTTFALYSIQSYFIGGGSTMSKPFIARHYPWELTVEERNNNEEFSYYIKNANPRDSSYKAFLRL